MNTNPLPIYRSRPLVLSADVVLAVLDGCKTQARVLVRPQPRRSANGNWWYGDTCFANSRQALAALIMDCGPVWPGDRLYVQEAWYTAQPLDADSPAQIAANCAAIGCAPWAPLQYAADNQRVAWDPQVWGETPGRLRQARHLPAWAARLWLEVVEVDAAPLQTLRDADALAEGILPQPGDPRPPRDYFMDRWDERHAARGHGWATDPFVWVYTFKRVQA